MRDYPAIFHLRVCRAKAELSELSALLEKLHNACQRDDDGVYSGVSEIDSVELEALEVLSKSVSNECSAARDALRWHKRNSE